MKFEELKKGLKVYDRWFPDWGTGVVDNILSTRVYVKFPYPKGHMKYDKAHVQFLERTR